MDFKIISFEKDVKIEKVFQNISLEIFMENLAIKFLI